MFDRQRRKNRHINSTYQLYSPTSSRSPSNTKNALSKICDPPIQCQPNTPISDAVSIMKDKRIHCLIINDAITGKLLGLVTTKDLAFRVVVNNLNSSKTSIDKIMTENPYFVSQFTSANEALKLMVDKKIRHLPLVDDSGIVTGMLNITTCFYHAMIRLEKMSEEVKELQCTFEDLKATDNNNNNNSINDSNSSINNANELEFSKYSLVNHSVLSPKIEIENEKSKINIDTIDLIALNEGLIDLDISTRKNKIVHDLKTLIEIMKQPDLKSLLNDNDLNIKSPVLIDSKTSILDAAEILVNFGVTSALIVHNINNYQIENVIGIFTTKDLVFRVLNCEIDSKISKVVRIMTPKPDFADESMGIHTALRLMYEGKYLNLPIKNSDNQITGLVNVLQLTYALLKTLEMSNINDNNNGNILNDYNNQQDNYLSKTINHETSSDFLASVNSDLETSGPAWNRFWGSLEKPLSTIPRHSRHSTTSLDVRRFGNYHRTTSFASFVSEPPIVKIENENEVQTGNEIEKKGINSSNNNKSLSDLKVIAMSTTSEFSDSTGSRLGISTSKDLMMDKKVMIKLKIKEQNGLNLGIHGKIYKFNIVIKEITDSSNYNILKFIKDKLRKRLKMLNQDNLKFEIGYFDEDGDLVSVERNEDVEIALEGNYKSLVLICHVKRKNNSSKSDESIPSWLIRGDTFNDIDFRIIATLLAGGIIFGGSVLLKYIANKK